jgi:2-polyprenyl-6-methoxyphenol hydroxylase-like FAD-dependent oxidoreductase
MNVQHKVIFHMHERNGILGGYVFLIRDTTHIHSPTSSQGMNLGIRDTIRLGKALAECMKTSQSPIKQLTWFLT